MVKKFDSQIMKFQITNDKLKMEASLKDLAWLFENSPNNFGYDGEGVAKVKCGKRQEFAEYIVEHLMDYSQHNEDNTVWGQPFEDIFEDIFEGAEDEFIKYPSDNEEYED